MVLIFILSAIAALLVVVAVVSYNRLTAAQNMVESAFGDIDVQLNLRAQLIPALVSATRGYASHEAELLEEIASRRSESKSPRKLAEEDEELFRAVRRVNVLAESYPGLKAEGPFVKLMSDLARIEDDLMSARRFYNGAVRVFNTRLQSFPANIVASLFDMRQAEFYIVAHDEERDPSNISL